MFRVNNKGTRRMQLTSFWCLYCQLCIYFTNSHIFFNVVILNCQSVGYIFSGAWFVGCRGQCRDKDLSNSYIKSRYWLKALCYQYSFSQYSTVATKKMQNHMVSWYFSIVKVITHSAKLPESICFSAVMRLNW